MVLQAVATPEAAEVTRKSPPTCLHQQTAVAVMVAPVVAMPPRLLSIADCLHQACRPMDRRLPLVRPIAVLKRSAMTTPTTVRLPQRLPLKAPLVAVAAVARQAVRSPSRSMYPVPEEMIPAAERHRVRHHRCHHLQVSAKKRRGAEK